MKSTKERILETAIDLFAIKGFNDVSIREITRAVGIKESSLYNHFVSKQQILDEIFDFLKAQLDKTVISEEQAVEIISAMSPEAFIDYSTQIFKLYMGDPLTMKIWRILSIERFRNEKANALFKKYLIDDAITYQSKFFSLMMERGLIRKFDPVLLAREFHAHTIFLYFRYFEMEQGANPAEDPDIQRMVSEHVDFVTKIISIK